MSVSISWTLHLCAVALLLLTWEVDVLYSQHGSCSQHTCRPPGCRCPTYSIPGNLQSENVPQMVLIAFDDAVNWDNWHYYLRLFPPDGRRKNPHGCPISATFFVSNNFTDYCMVSKLHARGMEIGDHSVTHKLPRMWWTDGDRAAMEYEVLNQRRNLAEKGNIPIEEIRGWRSPFLQPAGDDLFSVLHDNNFTYDATMTYSFPKNLFSPVLWPFTLDYGYTLVCNIARCPLKRYPGLWILPVVVVMDHRDQKPCAYVDDCANMPRDKNEAYQMLWKNFLRNYRSNRAPLYLNLHSPWLNTQYNLDAMDEFIEKMVSINDVYLVTVTQALQWQMDPTPLDQLHTFKNWQCPGVQPNAEDKKVCKFTFKHKTAPGGKNLTDVYGNGSDTSSSNPNTHKIQATVTPGMADHKATSPINPKHNIDKKPRRFGGSETTKENKHKSKHHEDGHSTHHDSELEEKSIIRHNHHHKTHKPWFLKGSASTTKPYILLLLFTLVCLSFVTLKCR